LEGRGRRSGSLSTSEQRRALLLPQEVKELGTEEAIVFYEGLRPIRCRKIRYFSDPRFRRRLLPPPASAVPAGYAPAFAVRPSIDRMTETPGPDTSEASRAKGKAESRVTAPKPAPIKEEIVIRDVTAADIERIETFELSDYAIDFSKVSFPDREGPLSAEEIDAAIDRFMDIIEQAREV
jgi:type IV secretion system protein VirD4